MKNDLQIAKEIELKPITEIAEQLNISDEIECYGKYKAKIDLSVMNSEKENGKLILVTAISPTKAGEGKTTMTVGLGQGFYHVGKQSVIALREPSLGPVMGLKGGAAGGGYSQVLPMEDLNLHFTGDIHAITTANNAICALLDNHIYQGNECNVDPTKIVFKRCLDLNDRTLRDITIGQGSHVNGIERKDGFNITVASEIMAILCLATSLEDLKQRIGNIIIVEHILGYGTCLKGEIGTQGQVGVTSMGHGTQKLLGTPGNPGRKPTLQFLPGFRQGIQRDGKGGIPVFQPGNAAAQGGMLLF